MLKVKELMDGVNRILVQLFPERTVYTDVMPEKFERPSFFILPGERKVTSLSAYEVEVETAITVQCIDEVGDHYETNTARLYGVTERLEAAFLQRGVLACADRRLTASRVDVSRALDVADVTITVQYIDARPTIPETAPLIEKVDFTTTAEKE